MGSFGKCMGKLIYKWVEGEKAAKDLMSRISKGDMAQISRCEGIMRIKDIHAELSYHNLTSGGHYSEMWLLIQT